MIQVKAQLNGLRISPRKVRLLVNLVKRRPIADAVDQLQHMTKRSSSPLIKLIESAAANAQNNFKLDREHLFIKDMWVDEGIKMKRYRPKGFGRASPIEKKTSRVNVVLEDRAPKPESKKAASLKLTANS